LAAVADASNAPDQIITLPSGGGAVRGLGETFAPDLQTGTGNLTIPLELPPGRAGMHPRLDLAYSTGLGNGPVGLGWHIKTPGVARKTSPVPTYRGEDTFLLSGVEDLVSVEQLADGTRFRPRTEGLFATIVRHGRDGPAAGQDYWETTGKDGIVTRYGTPRPPGAPADWQDPAVTADPAEPRRIFAWAITRTADRLGNVIAYEYEADEGQLDGRRWRLPVLRRIRYADYDAPDGSLRFLVSVELESEPRPDPFSTYTAGFEIRSTRRYRSLTTIVHAGADRPVRRYEFDYEQDEHNGASLLLSVAVVGFDDAGVAHHEVPAVRFGYGRLETVRRRFEPVGGADPPAAALSRPDHDLIDLTGDGLPSVVQLGPVARYWRNRGGGVLDRPRSLPGTPAGLRLADPRVRLLDADGDGRADLVVTTPEAAGFFPLRFGPTWGRFKPYHSSPSTGLQDPAVQLVDLTGDGVTDAVLSDARVECYLNDSESGWTGPIPARFETPERPPAPVGDARVRWVDMSGDGLRDLVWFEGGAFQYWPSLGHGRFGAPVRMANAPRLPPGYEPRRILLGDIDGDGCADVAYAAGGQVTIWFNRGGNGFSPPVTLPGVPEDDWDVRLADMLGRGTNGILFSRDAAVGRGRPSMYFLDLSGDGDARLLIEIDNQLGAVTRVSYTFSSTLAAADGARRATRWRTTLPMPVKVVARCEVIDQISGGKLTSEFRYRDGYWDGHEREFRGFARVDQTDSETRDVHASSPPTLSRTWFHVGPVESDAEGEWIELDLSEPWDGDPSLLDHASGIQAFLAGLPDRASRRDALRALRGRVMRTELYALDGSASAPRPYKVSEHAYGLRAEQSAGRPVFFAYETARRMTEWERGEDPLTHFFFTGDHDPFGQPRRTTTVAPPRRSACRRALTAAVVGAVDPDPVTVLATHERTSYAVPAPGGTIHDRVGQVRSYELAAPPVVAEPDPASPKAALAAQVAAARAVAATFAALAPADVRLIGHVVNHYDGPAYGGLDADLMGEHGLLTRSERLVFTDVILDAAYGGERPAALGGADPLPAGDLGYRRPAGAAGWYADEQARAFDVQLGVAPGRGCVLAHRDPLGHETTITPDPFALFAGAVRDAAGNTTTATYDYGVGRPRRIVDENGTSSEITFTPAGLVAAVVVVDRDGRGGTPQSPSVAYSYDLQAFADRGQPVYSHTRRRVWHASDGVSDEMIETREYSDGFGRTLQMRASADELGFADDTGLLGAGAAQAAVGTRDPRRVVVSGWKVYDHKGLVIEAYEPFFASGWDYAAEADAKRGQRIVTRYDPRGRPERVVNPDGSERRTLFGAPTALGDPATVVPSPWVTTVYDENDLAPLCAGPDGTPLAGAAPAEHHFTPTSTLSDALGRPVAVLAHGPPGGDRLRQTFHDTRGNPVRAVDEFGRTAETRVHDLTDRLLRTDSLDAGARTSLADANGNLMLTRDARGAFTLRAYDVLNRLTGVRARDEDNKPVTEREAIVYGDALASGPERDAAVAAQALGRIWSQRDEAGRLDFGGYDLDGHVLVETRTVVSDVALAAGWEPDWSAPGADDALEPIGLTMHTRYDALGRAVEIRAPSGRTLLAGFSRAGVLTSLTVDGETFVEHVAHNARGQRVLIAYGNGVMTRYGYDAATFRLSRLRSERATRSGDVWTGIGAPLQELSHSYDLVGNLTGVEAHTPGCGVAGTVEGRDQLTRTFTYDPFYRLTSATGRVCAGLSALDRTHDLPRCGAPVSAYPAPNQSNGPDLTTLYVETYTYDEAGNLLDLNHRPTSGPPDGGWHRLFGIGGRDPGVSSGAPDNQLTSVSHAGAAPLARGHDPAGNVISEGLSRHYRWDHAGRLTGFTVAAGAGVSIDARYLYDSAGGRVKKWVRTGGAATLDESTIYVHDLEAHDRWATGEAARLQVLDGHTRVAESRAGDAPPGDLGPPTRYELADQIGSAVLTLDAAGTWLTREEFFPYGETSYGGFARKRYRFQGKERDEESGLAQHGARYYAAPLGRWISPDPAGSLDGPNLYAAFGCSPLMLRDPTGTQNERPDGGTPASPTPVQANGVEPEHPPDAGPEEFWDVPARSSGGGAVTWWDSVQRGNYVAGNRAASGAARQEIAAALAEKNAPKAWSEAEKVSNLRDLRRTATQKKLSPGGRVLSEAIEEEATFVERVAKYTKRLPSVEGGAKVATRNAGEVSRRIAVAAGESRAAIKVLAKGGRVLGPIGFAVGAGFAIHAVVTAPEGQRGRVASREAGSFAGGALGATAGMGAAVAALGFVNGFGAGLLGVGLAAGPIGWVAIAVVGVAAAVVVGYWWSKRGGQIGEAAYDAVAH
jgi:RHS repeat-associated protein